MIQRIQSVYLFIAFLILGLLFFIPFSHLLSTEVYSISLKGVSVGTPWKEIQQPIWLSAVGFTTAILTLITIFLYKNRKVQMKLSLISIILSLGLNGAMYYITNQYHDLLQAEIKYTAVFIFPLIAAILIFMAYRAINKDEKLIKSLDRLR